MIQIPICWSCSCHGKKLWNQWSNSSWCQNWALLRFFHPKIVDRNKNVLGMLEMIHIKMKNCVSTKMTDAQNLNPAYFGLLAKKKKEKLLHLQIWALHFNNWSFIVISWVVRKHGPWGVRLVKVLRPLTELIEFLLLLLL